MNGKFIVLAAIFGVAAACRNEAPSRARRSIAAAPIAAEVGTSGDAAVEAGWVCGTASGLCTCVPLASDLQSPRGRCQNSSCCYVDASGRCTCRLSAATMSCEALELALSGAKPVAACPAED